MDLKFINDVVKPWEELNVLLAKRLAFQPDLSDATRLAASLAISIKHTAEWRGLSRKFVDEASIENRIMSDVADSAKHRRLRDPSRNANLFAASCFEFRPEREFRFIRNSVIVEHASLGEHDFLAVSLAAIKFWMLQMDFSLNRELCIAEGPEEFSETAYLYFDPQYCISMKQTRLKFYKRYEGGTYEPVDPPEVRFELFEVS